MSKKNPEIEKYIASAAPFAKPILNHWYSVVLKTCPEVVAGIKYGIPHFDYKGDYMCAMAAYSKHCSFTFFKAPLMKDPRLKNSKDLKPIQRFLGKISSMDDLPPDAEFIALLKETMELNEKGIKLERTKPTGEKPKVVETPDYFLARLNANPAAKEVFESKSNSFRKEYILWITDAKTEPTREKRMEEAIQWISEGKSRYWKSKK